jgi:hypothetical protein
VLPNSSLPPAGRAFADEFTKRFSQHPCCFSIHDARGTGMLLDAIAAPAATAPASPRRS